MKSNPDQTTDAWEIQESDFPENGSAFEQWELLLKYAVLAPSTHNSQPWQFHINGDSVELYADRGQACPVVDPESRELIISCGCALFNLRLAMRHFCLLKRVQLFPEFANPYLLARVWMGEQLEPAEEEEALFRAITRRRTNRQPFQPKQVPEPVLAALELAAARESAWIRIISDTDERYRIAELIAQADHQQWSDQAFREELARWLHTNLTPRKNGLPHHSFGTDDLLSSAEPLLVRSFDMGEGKAAYDEFVVASAPVLAVLMTAEDNASTWLAAGQALQSVLLQARAEDVWASFLSQPTEIAELRKKIPAITGYSGFPQTILRLGYGDEVTPSPRRPLQEVLI